MRHLARIILISIAWILAVGISAAAHGTTNLEQPFEEAVSFSWAFAVACAFSPVVALALGKRLRWAADAAIAFAGCILILGVAAQLFLRGSRTSIILPPPYFRILRQVYFFLLDEVIWTCTPVGLAAGAAVGVVAGLLMLIARRRPRLASAMATVMVVGFAAGGHEAVVRLGCDMVLHWRREGGIWAVSHISGRELSAALGASIGSLVGVLAAGYATGRALAGEERATRLATNGIA